MTDVANAEQYAAWNGDNGRRWTADPDGRDEVLAPVADALLAAATLRSGERVLDVGCGCGATTLAAAVAVVPDGAAVGADLSEPMLAVARRRASERGVGNVTFVHADAQIHAFDPAGFDVVVSRFGTMFFADPDAAFANLAGALRPGGRLCIVTWQPLLANDWLAIPAAALLRFGSPPDSGGPGMFAQSDPDLVASTLAGAGFDGIHVAPHTVTFTLGADLRAAAAFVADSGTCRAVLETVAPADRPTALAAIGDALADHVTAAGVQLAGGVYVTTAHRPM